MGQVWIIRCFIFPYVTIIMIVIYYGTDKPWDGARCLYDMLQIHKELEPFVTNYKLNLFDYHEYEDFSFLKSENRLLFETLASSKSKREMLAFFEENEKEYEQLDKTTKMLICDLIGLKNNKKIKKMIEEGGGMCQAIREIEKDAREEGREEGILCSIRNLHENMKISAQEAMDMLMIPKNKQKKYLKALSL